MRSLLQKLGDLVTLFFISSVFSTRSFAQMQTFYGVEPEEFPRGEMPVLMYGPPEPVFPSPQEDLWGFLLTIARLFAVPIIVTVILVIGVVFM